MFAGELRKQKAVFAAADGVALLGAFAAAVRLHDPSGAMETRLLQADPVLLTVGVIAVAGLWILVFHALDLYRMRNGGLRELFAIVKGCSLAALLTLFAVFLAHLDVSRIEMVLGYLFSMPSVLVARALTRACISHLYSNPEIAIPLVVIGFTPVGRYVFDQLLDEMTPYEPVGFLDSQAVGRQYRGFPVIGSVDRLAELTRVYPCLEAAIAMPDAPVERQGQVIRMCEDSRARWWMVPWTMRSLATGLKVDLVGQIPLIGPAGSNIEGLNFALKRAFDFVAASLLLVLTAPAIGMGALAIWLSDRGPVFFRQTRIGIHGRSFELLKLRTMRESASDAIHRDYVRQWIRNGGAAAGHGANGNHAIFKLTRDHRVTPVGRILRRFSIDELPQLINVIRGEMSLIGPRPALPYELDMYEEWHRRRLDAVPGITGLWQVSGRNQLSFEEMVRLDVQYLQDWSFGSDLKILARTVPALLRGEGV